MKRNEEIKVRGGLLLQLLGESESNGEEKFTVHETREEMIEDTGSAE